MTVLFAIVLVVHGLIHLLGFAKAFHLADLPQLTQPVSSAFGLLWLGAAILFVCAAGSLFLWPRWWWAIGAIAIVVSVVAIVPSWTDAKFGVVANAIALLGVLFGFLSQGPVSLNAAYRRDVDVRLGQPAADSPVTEADLVHLPAPVRHYLQTAGVVGRPRVRNFRVRMHGRIRSGPAARWIPFTAEQYNFVDDPARLFYLSGSMFLIPVQGYHRYVGRSATMDVRAAALFPVARASGAEMDQGETVTMFNDMCVMAPATLIDPVIVWTPIDARSARGRFANAGHTIHAELLFNDAGELIDFVSDDRYQTPADGGAPRRIRWSTPIREYRSFASARLASSGEGRWRETTGEYAYIELTIEDVQYNLSRQR